jgi:hypothetical protein
MLQSSRTSAVHGRKSYSCYARSHRSETERVMRRNMSERSSRRVIGETGLDRSRQVQLSAKSLTFGELGKRWKGGKAKRLSG